jgi:short subunit dehydrogenase-like uncharacterized protein
MRKESDADESSLETDITVYGATSFVAKHILHYLLEVSSHSPRQLRISLGGRTKSKLEALKSDLNQRENGKAIHDIVLASGSDLAGLKNMARKTRVVINCAGPFMAYSNFVVGACAEEGTDYVDITGEVAWSGQMRQTYGALAKASGSRIISFCGYDSVPSDLCLFASVDALRERRAGVNIESAHIWHESLSLPNGGTIHTALDIPIDPVHDFLEKKGKGYTLRSVPFMFGDPLLLTHPETVRHNPDYESTKNRLALGEWMNLLLNIDTNLSFGVSVPMPMAAINL